MIPKSVWAVYFGAGMWRDAMGNEVYWCYRAHYPTKEKALFYRDQERAHGCSSVEVVRIGQKKRDVKTSG